MASIRWPANRSPGWSSAEAGTGPFYPTRRIERGAVKVKSSYNAATARVTGIEPQYQAIRTIELAYGRSFSWQDESQVSRVAIVGFDVAEQLFGKRNILGESITLNGFPYTVVGKIRKKNQDSNYSGPDNSKIFVPFAAMSRDLPRRDAEPARSRTSSSRRTTPSSTICRARSTSAPAASRTSTGRSSRTSVRSSPAATASIRPTSRRLRCGTRRCRR